MSPRWTRRRLLTAAGVAAGGASLGDRLGDGLGASGVAARIVPGWGRAAVIARVVRPPRFPDRDIDVTDHGAVGDGSTDCTAAFAAAIAACAAAGGGRVVVPSGVFRTGAIHLRSNVNLHVTTDAAIRFVPDPNAYLPVVHTRWQGIELMNYSPLIYAFEQENIAVTGSGVLDGGADDEHWWPWNSGDEGTDFQALERLAAEGVPVRDRVFGPGRQLRPNFIQPYRCRNVLIEGVTFVRSPMWNVHPVLCENVTVQDIVVDGQGPNNDGCNPESCRWVAIRRCRFNAGDDCIAIKSGREADGQRIGVPSEDILIEYCDFILQYGAITLGSELTGGVRNVYVRHCRMGSPDLYFGLYIKTNSVRGGFAENIYLRDISASNVIKEFISCDFHRGEGDVGELTPWVRNVELRDVTVDRSRGVFYVRGYDRSVIQDFRLIDCVFADVWRDNTVENVEFEFENVRVNGELVTPEDFYTG